MKLQMVRGCAVAGLAIAVLLGGAPARADDLTGKASVGFAMGVMRYTGGDSLATGAGIRPMLRATVKYVWDEHLVSVLETGYGWNAYGPGGDYNNPQHPEVATLAVVIPLTMGMDYRFQTGPRVSPRVGAGAGIYGVTIRSGRDRVSLERVSHRRRVKTGPGVYLKGGTEVSILPAMYLNADLLWHYAFTADETRFPEGWLDQNVSFAEVRVGLNYYFTIRSTGAAPRKPTGGEE